MLFCNAREARGAHIMDLNDPFGKKIEKKNQIFFLTSCFEGSTVEQALHTPKNPKFPSSSFSSATVISSLLLLRGCSLFFSLLLRLLCATLP